jgi:hypothetical protein
LELELEEVRESAAKDVAAFVARLAAVETCATEASASVERGFAAYRFDLASDLEHLRETYEHNI